MNNCMLLPIQTPDFEVLRISPDCTDDDKVIDRACIDHRNRFKGLARGPGAESATGLLYFRPAKTSTIDRLFPVKKMQYQRNNELHVFPDIPSKNKLRPRVG
jgi:hypothetical protein